MEHEELQKLRDELKTYYPDKCNSWKEIDRRLKEHDQVKKNIPSRTYNLIKRGSVKRIEIYLQHCTSPFLTERCKEGGL